MVESVPPLPEEVLVSVRLGDVVALARLQIGQVALKRDLKQVGVIDKEIN